MIGLGTAIDQTEFNRRAVIALRGVSRRNDFVTNIVSRIERCLPLSAEQQQAFINTVHDFRREITDQLVKDFAATKRKGYS